MTFYDAELADTAFTLGEAFPEAQVDWSAAQPGEAAAIQAALWMGRIWGARSGYACLGFGHGGHRPAGGSYRFERFEEQFIPWPDGRQHALDLALRAAETADVYVGVLLRARKSRRRGDAMPGRVAWADVDGPWTPERQAALDRLAGEQVWQVDSGGGRHVYLRLDEPEFPERLESWNRRLGKLLDADAGWSETKILRLPGTFNHKPRADGEASWPVRWVR